MATEAGSKEAAVSKTAHTKSGNSPFRLKTMPPPPPSDPRVRSNDPPAKRAGAPVTRYLEEQTRAAVLRSQCVIMLNKSHQNNAPKAAPLPSTVRPRPKETRAAAAAKAKSILESMPKQPATPPQSRHHDIRNPPPAAAEPPWMPYYTAPSPPEEAPPLRPPPALNSAAPALTLGQGGIIRNCGYCEMQQVPCRAATMNPWEQCYACDNCWHCWCDYCRTRGHPTVHCWKWKAINNGTYQPPANAPQFQ